MGAILAPKNKKLVMRNVVHYWSLLLLLVPWSLFAQTTATAPGGSGTEGDPFVIATLGDLSYVTQNLGAIDYVGGGYYFLQTAAIDAAATQYWDDSDDNGDGDAYNDPNDGTTAGSDEGFRPIGYGSGFIGQYDGGYWSISNISIDREITPANPNHIGVFGWLHGTLERLIIVDANITAEVRNPTGELGVVVGYADHGSVDNVTVTNGQITVTAASDSANSVGGLIGEIDTDFASISGCFVSVDIDVNCVDALALGGMLGWVKTAINVSDCGVEGSIDVESPHHVGGFSGVFNYGEFSGCFADVDITASYMRGGGGFTGGTGLSTGSNSYARGSISGFSAGKFGGFFGISYAGPVTLTDCYAAPVVSGGAITGGFGGHLYNGGPFTDCYWDVNTTGESLGLGNAADKGDIVGGDLTTSEMQTESTFSSAGWNFSTVWGMASGVNDGYPYLRGVTPSPPLVSTQSTTGLSTNGATFNGNLEGFGSATPTRYGFCYSTSSNPDLNDVVIDLGIPGGTGSFSATISNRLPGAVY